MEYVGLRIQIAICAWIKSLSVPYSIFAETQLEMLHAGPDFNLCKISMNNKV